MRRSLNRKWRKIAIFLHLCKKCCTFAADYHEPLKLPKSMKTITVSLDVFLGYNHYGAVDTDGNVSLEVSDEVAALLQSLQDDAEPLTKEDIEAAIEQGHTLLRDMHQEILDCCENQELIHWCLAVDDCIDETLEPSFYEDVESGIYTPEPDDEDEADEDENMDDEDEEDDDMEDDDFDQYHPDYDACRNNYLAWVRSHTDDPLFMAFRLGVSVDVCPNYDNYSYTILKIE